MSEQDDARAQPAQQAVQVQPALQASADRSVALDLAGGPLVLSFSPGHADLAAETEELWAHLLRPLPGDAPAEPDAGAVAPADVEAEAGAESETVRRLRVVTTSETQDDADGNGAENAGQPVAPSEVIEPGPGAAYALSGAITRVEIESLIGTQLLLHAGTVRTPDLGVVVLVGPSGAGKSTATTVLGRLGEYLTDELTIIDPQTLQIQAFSKPVSRVDAEAEGRLKKDRGLPGEGLSPIASASAPDHLVLLRRRTAADATDLGRGEAPEVAEAPEAPEAHEVPDAASLRRVPLADAILRIVEQSSSLWKLEDGLGVLARLLARTSGALEAVYTDAEELADLLASPPPPLAEEWTSLGHVAAQSPQSEDQHAILELEGALLTDSGSVLLRAGRVLQIQGIAELAWDILREEGPMTGPEIQARIVQEAGDHPEAADRIAAALASLLAESIIVGPAPSE